MSGEFKRSWWRLKRNCDRLVPRRLYNPVKLSGGATFFRSVALATSAETKDNGINSFDEFGCSRTLQPDMSLWGGVLEHLPACDDDGRLAGPSNGPGTLEAHTAWLEAASRRLAASEEARQKAFAASEDVEQRERAMEGIARHWQATVRHASKSHYVTTDGDEPFHVVTNQVGEADASLRVATLSARILRNAVAGQYKGQCGCYDAVMLSVFATLWMATAHKLESEEGVRLLTRALVQLMSNIITDNEDTQHQMWHLGLQLGRHAKFERPEVRDGTTPRRGSELLERLLQSPDTGTSLAASVLLLNLLASSKERSAELAQTEAGLSIVGTLLQLVQQRLNDDEDEEEREEHAAHLSDQDSGLDIPLQPDTALAQRKQARFEALGVLYTLSTRLLDHTSFGSLFDALRRTDLEGDAVSAEDGGDITPSQIALLKLFDAHIHTQNSQANELRVLHSPTNAIDGTLPIFLRYARWAQQAMDAALKTTGNNVPPVDVRLVDVHVALILTLQILRNAAMASASSSMSGKDWHSFDAAIEGLRQEETISALLALLRSTNAFAPAASPFVNGGAQQRQSDLQYLHAPQGHALSSTGRAALNAATSDTSKPPRPRLDKLKRDLVALISVLSFARDAPKGSENGVIRKASSQETASVRRFQDAIREQGGLVDVLNMTQLDENNPYIREYAIFALRNLLKGNQESQDFIARIRPLSAEDQHTMSFAS